MESWNKRMVFVRCEDHCGNLTIDRWDEDDFTEYFISYNVPAFSSLQSNRWYDFKEKIKFLWMILTGKEYRLYELIIREKDFEQFIRNGQELIDLKIE